MVDTTSSITRRFPRRFPGRFPSRFLDDIKYWLNCFAIFTTKELNIEIIYNDTKYNQRIEPAVNILIKPSFFRIDNCKMCGNCCKSLVEYIFWTENVWTENEGIFDKAGSYDIKINIKINVKINVKINEQDYHILGVRAGSPCIFLTDDSKCSIHEIAKPLQCLRPHKVIYRNNKNSIIFKKQPFARRWARKKYICPVSKEDFLSIYTEEERHKDLSYLALVGRTCQYFNISTKLVDKAINQLSRIRRLL